GPRNGSGDEVVGRRDDGAEVTLREVALNQLDGTVADGRANDFRHEFFAPAGQLRRCGAGQQPQHELRRLFRGELSGVVALHEFFVARLGLRRVTGTARAG